VSRAPSPWAPSEPRAERGGAAPLGAEAEPRESAPLGGEWIETRVDPVCCVCPCVLCVPACCVLRAVCPCVPCECECECERVSMRYSEQAVHVSGGASVTATGAEAGLVRT